MKWLKWGIRAVFFALEAWVFWLFWEGGNHWALSVLYAILCVEVPLYILSFVYAFIGMTCNVPLWWQRPVYHQWKVRLAKKEFHPLFAYPFHIFLAFELDKHFEKGGIKAAQAAASEWGEKHVQRLTDVITSIAQGTEETEVK